VGVGGEHIGVDIAPHHQLDYRLLHALVDEVGDPGVAEDVRGDLLLDPGPLCELVKVLVDRAVGERLVLVCDEDEVLARRI